MAQDLDVSTDNETLLRHDAILHETIGSALEIHRLLGFGFLKRVYQRAMEVELVRRGIPLELEYQMLVRYKDAIVGVYQADLLVANAVMVELNVDRTYNADREPQLLNKLKATGVNVGLLINFGRRKLDFKQMVW
jgi:GxxExxY protein